MFHGELVIDNFAGGGGTSVGIEQAIGRPADIAINHDANAIAMHAINHPGTIHYCQDIWTVDPREVCQGRPVGLVWFSPDCKHFSRAKGGKPVNDRIRDLAWVVIKWAGAVKPRVIVLENVAEFADWGPLQDDGLPCKRRKGMVFKSWCTKLKNQGYRLEWRLLKACDYGAPTIRKRLFLVARRDDQIVSFPHPTHGKGLKPFRTAADCIDWSIPCPSIFDRKKPLAEATLRRIARGLKRFVIDCPEPFIVPLTHQGERKVHHLDEPFPTVTGANRGELALVTPYLSGCGGRAAQSPPRSGNAPMGTITSKADQILVAPMLTKFQQNSIGQDMREPTDTVMAGAPRFGLVASTLVQYHSAKRPGDDRVRDILEPLPTQTTENRFGLVHAFLAKHYGGHETPGASLDDPMSTITAKDHHALVTSNLIQLKGTAKEGKSVEEPMPSLCAGGFHMAEVRAFLIKYFGTGTAYSVDDPMHTISTKDRFGLVMVHGEPYAIADIGMRMLSPRELFRAQGFPESFIIDPIVDGKPLSRTDQIKACGNSVCPPIAKAIVREVGAPTAYAQPGELPLFA